MNVHNLAPLLAVVPDNEISEVDKFCFHPVSSREIQKIVMSLQSNKAPGHDKVSTSVLKDALPCILPILSYCLPFLIDLSLPVSLEKI